MYLLPWSFHTFQSSDRETILRWHWWNCDPTNSQRRKCIKYEFKKQTSNQNMIQFLLLPCDDNLNWSSVPGLTLVANISHPKLCIYGNIYNIGSYPSYIVSRMKFTTEFKDEIIFFSKWNHSAVSFCSVMFGFRGERRPPRQLNQGHRHSDLK